MGKTPEREAQDSEVIETLFNSSSCGVAIFDDEFRYVRVNDTLARMDGFAADFHIGKTVSEVLGIAAADMENQLEEVFASAQRLDNFHLAPNRSIRVRSGQWNVSYFPMKDHDGKVTQVCAIVSELVEDHSRDGYYRNARKPTSPTPRQDARLLQSLTKRQHEVFQYLASGKSNKEVAAALDISVRTVETYRKRIMEKLEIHSLVDLVRLAVNNRIPKL